ncbi:hypothetical protein [uncultured Polaribacter sp.]|uniref:hypothetical protein n=1 Tax=uncultured Polaribacter sp. TaxID=174711 RepID=UPI00262B14C9|nr:hypothetical protein [uncultured Polaribacter sp.]
MKSHKEILDEFLVFEKENNYLDWEIDSVPIWELLRTIVFTKLSSKLVNNTVVERNNKEGSRVKLFFNIVYNSIFHNPFFTFEKKDIIILNHPRRKFNKGFFEDIYIDNLLPSLGNKYVLLEGFVSHNLAHLKPIRPTNLFYLDIIQFTGSFISKNRKKKLSVKHKEDIKNLEHLILKTWGVKINNLENEICIIIKKWIFTKKCVEKLIVKISPKLLINVVSYSFINQVFNFVAKGKKIPVIELQHGTVGRYHINYNFNIPKGKELKTFPNYFLSWGKGWTENSRLPLLKNNIIETGYPHINIFRKDIQNIRNPKQIVFISQVREDIAYFTEEVAKILPTFKIIFKAHPVEYSFAKSKYSLILKSKNIEIITNDNKNLYHLFNESSAVFGVYSTALIEALAFCPKVGIIKLSGWEYFEDLEESNNLKFVNSQNDVKKFILNVEHNKNNCKNNYYFEDNSQERIIDFLNKYL